MENNSAKMIPVLDSLPNDLPLLREQVIAYAMENELLREQVRLLTAQLYCRTSERVIGPNAVQLPLPLFPEDAIPPEPTDDDRPKSRIAGPVRNRRGRRSFPDSLPRIEVMHDVPESEKICACCNRVKGRIGVETSEQIAIEPARIQVHLHVRPKYACQHCEGSPDAGPVVVIAPPAPHLIPKCSATPGFLAHTICGKYVDGLPFYRQEAIFARLGIDISRATMCNWLVKAAEKCSPVMEALREEIRAGPLINADETTLQVLNEPGRDPTAGSYIWVFRGGTVDGVAIEFSYSATRAGAVAMEYLRGYSGAVQTDGYSGYDFLDYQPGVEHGGCWAHARRGFDNVLKAMGKVPGKLKSGVAAEALLRIQELYMLERRARKDNLGPVELLAWRLQYAKPKLAAFKEWLDLKAIITPPNGLLGKAIAYTRNQWARLARFADSSVLQMDNNAAENVIRPFVIGRKNWLFSSTPAGANASATMYSLIETAKANGLEPYWYMRALFERLPLVTSADGHKALLPQYIDRSTLRPEQPQVVH